MSEQDKSLAAAPPEAPGAVEDALAASIFQNGGGRDSSR